MKKKAISLFLSLVMCLTLLPTAALAESAASGNAITLSFTGDCDTAHTQTVFLKDYLPAGAVVTGISSSLSNIVKSITPEYTYTDSGTVNVENAKFSYTTREQDEPASGIFTVTVSTSSHGDYMFSIHITLTGKYLVTLSAIPQNALYDGQPHNGYSNLKGTLTSGEAYTGDCAFAYAVKNGATLSEAPSEIGDYTVTISIPESNEGYKHKEVLILDFSILDSEKVEAQYQSETNGAWLNGTFEQALANVYEGGTIKLLKDVVLTRTATLAKKMTITSFNANTPCTITSNTNEHGYLLTITNEVKLENVIVDGGSKSNITAQRAAIAVNGGKLTLGGGAIVQNNKNVIETGAGGGVCVISGELNIQGGKISGNQAYWGGGVAVMRSAKAQMTSGSIVQNKSTSSTERGGGGIYLSYGDFDLNGGEITENTAEKSGGGVYIHDGALTVSGGHISENNAGSTGGAVFVNAGNLHLTRGNICNNSATNFAGGIECAPASNIVIAGEPVVTGNTSGEETNGGIYPDGTHNYGGYYPNITIGALNNGAAVDFYTWLKRDGFLIACPVEDHTITMKDLSKLSFEDDDFALKLDDSGNLVLTNVGVYQITFDANGGSVKTETAKTAEGKLAALPTPTHSGYTFVGWYTEAEGGEQVTADTVFAAVSTIYAHWTRNSSSSGSSSGSTKYAITVDNGKNGNVTADRKSTSKGTTVTVTVIPDEGYTLETLTVTDKNGNALELTDKGNGKYTFKMPASKVTVSATFAPEKTVTDYFADVPAGSYYADAVLWAAKKGVTGGIGNSLFAPDETCTRAQIVTFLWRAAGTPEPKAASGFTDVPDNAYYAKAVAWAVENGITGGIGNNLFAPDQTCTRAQAVAFLFRYAAANGMDAVTLQELVSGYGDAAQVPGYALSAFNWALANGVVTGNNGNLMPNDDCTRAQIVTMLYRLLGE